jgi:peptidoglycan/xylan/chitin deacetylase (PgdA/CDA1 family)
MRLLSPTLLILLLAVPLVADDAPVATILAYHEVDSAPTHATTPRQSAKGDAPSEQRRYTASPEQFREQLDYLAANGYHVVPLGDLVAYLAGRINSLPKRAVVITVDDGWSCTYTTIVPELRRRGMPVTVFVYPRIVGKGTHAVTWAQVAEMAGMHGIEIGSHSYTHPFLSQRNAKGVTDYEAFLHHELVDSRSAIEKLSGARVRHFCYPFGDYDDAVIAAVKRYGYEAGLTTERGVITRATSPMRLKRYLIHNDTTLAEFKTFLLP